ncbi:MAG TPA: MCE family protein [Actinoallomurus sp.]|jgi:phospholipid/cholesterol/gamma-HCH transport system substrate-binding protein
MGPFRERNPLPIGIAGLAVVGLLALLAFNLQRFSGGTGYSAAFSEAAGLKPGEEVRIAGVKVGKVDGVTLEGDHVKVKFTSGRSFGTDTRVQIKIKTLLGSHYLALEPKGPGRQPADREIPVTRTTAPYDVVPALQDASSQLGKIDTKQLAASFDTLSQTVQGSSANVRGTLAGLQKISRAVASRDDELGQLLQHTNNVTGLLADRSGDLAALVNDGGLLLQEINSRRVVINQLLTGTVSLSQQITGTIQENQATLGPTLKNLHQVENILNRNQENLDKSFKAMAPFANEVADYTGTGRWFDVYLQNLVPLPASVNIPGASGKSTKIPPNNPLTPSNPPATPRNGDPLPIIK